MPIVVIAHNIRSIHNVGSLFRTCDGFGIAHLYLSGYTPYPGIAIHDNRLPHLSTKISSQIHKTALGAEATVPFTHIEHPKSTIEALKAQDYQIVGLEQTPSSIPLPQYKPAPKLALLLGEEVHGIAQELLAIIDATIEIPMYGTKESFNVSVATGIALYAIKEHGN